MMGNQHSVIVKLGYDISAPGMPAIPAVAECPVCHVKNVAIPDDPRSGYWFVRGDRCSHCLGIYSTGQLGEGYFLFEE